MIPAVLLCMLYPELPYLRPFCDKMQRVVVYPAYIDAKLSIAGGRKISQKKGEPFGATDAHRAK